MAMVITTNTASINAQRHLNTSRQDLDVAMERLSSGQRINSAADDAAGLAIRDKMTSQIEGLNQAVRNANDAISFMQTAEGALEETTNILQRMRTLAVQSVNDTNTTNDRTNLNDELVKLKEEITRIAENSTFNNKNLIDGSMSDSGGTAAIFQIGHNADQKITINLNDMASTALGDRTQTTATAATYSSTAVTFEVDATSGIANDDTVSVVVDGQTFTTDNLVASSQSDGAAIAAAFAELDVTGWDISASGAVATFKKNEEYVGGTTGGSVGDTGQTAIQSDAALTVTVNGDGVVTTTTVTDSTAGSVAVVSEAALESIDDIDILTSSEAEKAIASIDQALLEVGQERSKLGAFQNRLQFAVNNMTNMSANTSAARSIIADADYAAESSSLAKNQILQQAGTAMLAQANAQAQSVLSLLK